MGADGLCGLRSPRVFRACAQVLRSGTSVEVGATTEAGRTRQETSFPACQESCHRQSLQNARQRPQNGFARPAWPRVRQEAAQVSLIAVLLNNPLLTTVFELQVKDAGH